MNLHPAPYSKDYDITDAMFGVFRTPGGMPFFWKLFGFGTLLFAIIGVLTVRPILSSYVDLIRASFLLESDPDVALQALATIGHFFFVMMLFTVGYAAVAAVIRSAFFRGYFFGDLGGSIPFKVGRDEVRQWLSYLGFYVIVTLTLTLALIALMVPFMILMFITGGDSMGVMVLGIVVVYTFSFAAFIWIGVRLSTAGALTALRGKTHLLAARYVTKNRFWPLLGSILVAGLFGYVLSYIAMTMGLMVAFPGLEGSDLITIMMGTDQEGTLEALDRASDSASFNLKSVLAIVLASAGYSFYVLILAGPQAFFTQQWAEAGGERD